MKFTKVHKERMIVGMGETVFDILFRHGQPTAAVPGGSSFNSLISVGRTGLPCCFAGYTGADRVGQQVVDFLTTNNVSTACFEVRPGEKSAVSLAFLDENGDASYSFYREPLRTSDSCTLPSMKADDILLYGSYYAICHGMRSQVTAMLHEANNADSIVYYDINFRNGHRHELAELMPAIESNIEQSTLVRGSADDFDVIYGMRDAQQIYEQHIHALCPLFICTAGAGRITVCTPNGTHQFQSPRIDNVVSTVGAGDNFNAGFCCALVWKGITKERLPRLTADEWQEFVATACRFAAEACRSTDNYVSRAFAQAMASASGN